MELTRRFVFKGYASAISGLLYVPKSTVIEIDGGSSALGIAGGRARSDLHASSFGDAVRVGSATTVVEGLFDDEKQARAVVSHKGRQEDLTSTTTVTADVRELNVGNNKGPFVTMKRLRATLVSRSPDGSGEPRIAPGRDTVIQGVAVNGYGLTVTLNLPLFQTLDTRSKVVAAADDPKVVRTAARHLFMTASGKAQAAKPRLVVSAGVIYSTIVRDLRWSGKPYPGARIDGHTVTIPDFGTMFLGELMIAPMERRLTLARFELGSPLRGYVGGGDVGSNGSWYP